MTDPIFIEGEPYPAEKKTGNKLAPEEWSGKIVEGTRRMDPIREPCRLEVEFILTRELHTDGGLYGTDLDNLLALLFDALAKTVLAEANGKDSAIVEVRATKRWAAHQEPAGVRLLISPRPWP